MAIVHSSYKTGGGVETTVDKISNRTTYEVKEDIISKSDLILYYNCPLLLQLEYSCQMVVLQWISLSLQLSIHV